MKLKATSIDATERESFLQSLYQKQPTTSLPDIDWEELNSWCESIDTGEYYLFKVYNEEYDDWYDDAKDEYEIEDPFKITDKIYDIFYNARKFAYAKEYAQALTLYDLLFQRTYHMQSNYGDIETMGLLTFLMESENSGESKLEGKFRKSYGKAALLNIGLQYVFDNLHMGISAKDRCKSRYQRRPAFYQEWDDICGK